MNVKIDCNAVPIFLAHGGAATQIYGTLEGIRQNGVNADFSKWWEGKAEVDIIHYFGIPNQEYLSFAKGKNIPIVSTNLFTAACNRSYLRMTIQGLGWKICESLGKIPIVRNFITNGIPELLRQCDKCIVGLESERQVLMKTYRVPAEKIIIVPLALDKAYFEPLPKVQKKQWLINTGTITPRKRSLELAQMAHEAKVPILFVGKPYDGSSKYWHDFKEKIDNDLVRHIAHTDDVSKMIELLLSAKGFVLYSDYENWCLSAHEAAACGLPLLLPDQAWSRERFGEQCSYFSSRNKKRNIVELKRFYQEAASLSAPNIEHLKWAQIGEMLISTYKDLLSNKIKEMY